MNVAAFAALCFRAEIFLVQRGAIVIGTDNEPADDAIIDIGWVTVNNMMQGHAERCSVVSSEHGGAVVSVGKAELRFHHSQFTDNTVRVCCAFFYPK